MLYRRVFLLPSSACFSVTAKTSFVSRMSSSYRKAINRLQQLQSITSVVRSAEDAKTNGNTSTRNENVNLTAEYLSRLDISQSDLEGLRVIHVAGTKGKGSTCALVESILRHSGYRTGFTSSPHLMEVRERIRLEGKVISRDLFAQYFFEMWEQFQRYPTTIDSTVPRFPSFIKYLTVMAYYVFVKEEVDVAIVEVGLGGRFDCTNVVERPSVTAITHLGYDHCSILGDTIEEIAWEKSGIIKPGVPLFTIPQHYTAAQDTVKKEAQKMGVPLFVVPPLEQYPNPPSHISSETWSDNLSLALQLCRNWENQSTKSHPVANPFHLPHNYHHGVSGCQWPGRNHIVERGSFRYFLDGAHTPVSIGKCTEWFNSTRSPKRRTVLIANTTRDRKIAHFLNIIRKEVHLDEVIFCPNIATPEPASLDCEWPADVKKAMIRAAVGNSETWREAYPDTPSQAFPHVSDAIQYIESGGCPVDILVTGSLHLVGATLTVLCPDYFDEEKVVSTGQAVQQGT